MQKRVRIRSSSIAGLACSSCRGAPAAGSPSVSVRSIAYTSTGSSGPDENTASSCTTVREEEDEEVEEEEEAGDEQLAAAAVELLLGLAACSCAFANAAPGSVCGPLLLLLALLLLESPPGLTGPPGSVVPSFVLIAAPG